MVFSLTFERVLVDILAGPEELQPRNHHETLACLGRELRVHAEP